MARAADTRDQLLDIASSISDGTEIDWTKVSGHAADDETPSVVMQLQVVEQIARLHTGSWRWESLQIRETIGRGSFGVVHRAFDPDLERAVALKVVEFAGSDSRDADHAVTEARMLARVKNPHVVTVFRAERRGLEIGIWMELIEGVTLEDLVKKQGAFSAHEAILIGIDVCNALAAIHGAGLVHGDIKAHNVMRERGGRIVVMDFGAAKDLARAHDAAAGDFAGTPLYAAPEIFRGEPRSKASDLYSVGVLLYYLATATYPVEGSTKTEIGRRHDRGRPHRRLRDARPDLPRAIEQVVERALSGDPANRYRSAGEFEAALIDASKRSREMPTQRIAAAVLAAMAIAGTLWFAWTRGSVTPATAANTAAAASAPPAAVVPSSYQIGAALYRVRDGGDERLAAGGRLERGDRLYLRVESSAAAHVYVVNEDERGDSYLLFPLPGQDESRPLLASQSHDLPGLREGKPFYWVVTSNGGREHFLIFASPERMIALEQIFAKLPAPALGKPATAVRLTDDAVATLRGIGGLAEAPLRANASMQLAAQFTTPLSDTPETVSGLWVRRLTIENPSN